MSFMCWIAFLARFFFSRRATRISPVAYATAVWLFAYYPWNFVLLALVAGFKGASDSDPKEVIN